MDAELGELTEIPLPCKRALPTIVEEVENPCAKAAKPYSSVVFSAAEKGRKKLVSDTVYCIVSVVTLVVVVGLCVLCYLFCIPCLFGIIAVSCCLCPWMTFFNIPLWLSILLLVYTSWHFTAHIMGVTTHFNYA